MNRLRKRFRSIALFDQLGPGLVTGAADDDPSGIATYSQAGAQFGFGLLWTLLLTYPFMVAIQLISARIGRVTGCGLSVNMGRVLPRSAVDMLVGLLFIANTVNIGADIAAMGEAAELMAGFGSHVFTIVFALLSLVLQLFVPYRRYVTFLKWLTLSLFAYVAVVFIVHIDWALAVRGMIWPAPQTHLSRDFIITVVAVFGTTISPYLFFWQAAEEIEDLHQESSSHALRDAPLEAPVQLKRMRLDTLFGMGVSNLIALAIMLATAATLHASGKTDIRTASDAARALEPVAGHFAFALFSLGIIGTGLLAVPVLAGSAAYAVGETRGWSCGLDHKPWEAVGFYAVIATATVLGIAIDWSPIDPMKALYWSAVLNGIVAVPMMVAMMLVVTRHRLMGTFVAGPLLRGFGWAATALMAAAALAMLTEVVLAAAA
jgi:NRAMP (natural resistance-associated macrophage protein)-like metal ion transporter